MGDGSGALTLHQLQELSVAAGLLADAAGAEDRNHRGLTIGERLASGVRHGRNLHDARVEFGGLRAVLDEFSPSGPAYTGYGNVTPNGATSLLASPGTPQLSTLRRRMVIRDLVPVYPIEVVGAIFARELNPLAVELAASGVAEGNLKPDAGADANFVPLFGAAGTLAVNASPTRQLVEDSPVFAQWLSDWLSYTLAVREEYAFLRGAGETVNGGLTGVLNTVGVASQAQVSGDPFVTATQLAATVAAAGWEPDGLICSYIDYLKWLGHRGSGGSGPAETYVWGDLPFPVVPTLALPAGTAIAGCWRRGAAILDREEGSVQAYPQHSDYAARNQVLIQAEERVGWVVIQPTAFAFCTGMDS